MGVVQGLTEFLPVSSSAHLVLVRDVLGWDAGETELVFDVACHLGTLIAVVVYFWRDLVQLIVAVPRVALVETDEATQLGRLIVVATLPVALVGVFFAELIAPFRTPVVATVTLAFGGALMLVADRVGAKRRKSSRMPKRKPIASALKLRKNSPIRSDAALTPRCRKFSRQKPRL